jgi:FtsP/CotA-like multicopper oxidase with cupredoxin domain
MICHRRTFLKGTLATGAAGLVLGRFAAARAAVDVPIRLRAETQVIEVNGKPATVFGIRQPDGTAGLTTSLDRRFAVELENRIAEDTLIHWHGLAPPYKQDGVPEVSQPALPPTRRYSYDFALDRPGTYWMHSHQGMQEQQLMTAPLIVRDPAEAGLDEQEVVVLLGDFSFKDPAEIFAGLRGKSGAAMPMAPGPSSGAMTGMDMGAASGSGAKAATGGMAGTDMSGSGGGPTGTAPGMAMDINDVDYDAYLANDRTLADPEIVRVEAGGRVRLRIINGASSTNFILDLGGLPGSLIAVDGQPVAPVEGRRFDIAIAQRVDLRLRLPQGEGAYPVLAWREGDRSRTGIVLATAGAKVARIAEKGEAAAGLLSFALEAGLKSLTPLAPRPVDRRLNLDLTGDMARYEWGLNGQIYGRHTPLRVVRGQRVEVVIRNRTGMSHPMHLHGHRFQLIEADGKSMQGALRDTVLVLPRQTVVIAFDADNPGRWVFHCHNLYHMEAGMMTTVEYEAA